MSRAKKPAQLRILLDEKPIGTVVRDGAQLSLVYDKDMRQQASATILSLSMPLTRLQHEDPIVSNFLWNLLPDNELILNAWAQRAHVSPRSVFQLIGAVGEDLPGAIQAAFPDDLEELPTRMGVKRISRDRMAELVRVLLRSPGETQFTEHGGRFSLAGAQSKKAINWTNNVFYDPQGRTPSTHILKPPISGLDGQVENEHFCLRLASKVGLRAARSSVVVLGDIPVIVVERFDRIRRLADKRLPLTSAGGEVIRIHQEDFCQALGVHPSSKYQSDGGPGIKQIMSVLSGSQTPDADRSAFMRAIALNYVVAGTDAHAKNYGLLHLPGGVYRMAPLYDVISALPYEDRHKDRKLAMSVAGEYRYDRLSAADWVKESNEARYDQDAAIGHVRDLLARVPEAATEVLRECKAAGLLTASLDRLANLIERRCADLQRAYGKEAA